VDLRVLTWNIHKGIGGVDRRYRPERIRDLIAHHDPDVCLLQEVDSGAKRSNGDHQVDLLGEWCGYDHRTWFPNVPVRGGGRYGNAILSRWPITATENIDVTIPGTKKRSVLHAATRVRRPDGHTRTVHYFTMHLSLAGWMRNRQLQRFMGCKPFARLHHDTPVIVGGDLNDVWGTIGKRWFAPAGFVTTAKPLRTFPAVAPVRALDAVYLRGNAELASVHRSRMQLARAASDHLPLIATVVVP
jgi:endonuclease/exonuclease/phosphatase family metal-dependent hydrolase